VSRAEGSADEWFPPPPLARLLALQTLFTPKRSFCDPHTLANWWRGAPWGEQIGRGIHRGEGGGR